MHTHNTQHTQGSFGQVVQAHDLLEERDVAIKIIKNQEHFARQARVEISILQLLNQHDPDGARHIGVCLCVCVCVFGRSLSLSLVCNRVQKNRFTRLESMEMISMTY